MSKRIDKLEPPGKDPPEDSGSTPPENSSSDDDERGVAKPEGTGNGENQPRKHETIAGSEDNAGESSATGVPAVDGRDRDALSGGEGGGSLEGKDGQGRTTAVEDVAEGDGKLGEKGREGLSEESESEEDRVRREELEVLKTEKDKAFMDMLICSKFHHLFEDSTADDGLVPDMPEDDDDEGGGEAPSAAAGSS